MSDEHNLETAAPWNRRYAVPSYSGTGAGRTAESHTAFLAPYLRPGMDLLDCGAGRGTITSGLAQLLSPGRVVGIDISEKAVERAADDYSGPDFENLTFRQADIYELPFEDETFDAAFSHACLSNLQEPSRALREMWRVLRPAACSGFEIPTMKQRSRRRWMVRWGAGMSCSPGISGPTAAIPASVASFAAWRLKWGSKDMKSAADTRSSRKRTKPGAMPILRLDCYPLTKRGRA